MRFTLKILISAVLIAAASEFAKRSPKLGGLLISLPLTTILATLWLYLDTHSAEKVMGMLWNTLSFLIPSLTYFFSMILLLRLNVNFYISMIVSVALTMLSYYLYYKLV